MGAETLEHLIFQCHINLPDNGITFNKHKDIDNRKRFYPNWKDTGFYCSYATGVIEVDPMYKDSRGVFFELGSQRGQENKEVFCAFVR